MAVVISNEFLLKSLNGTHPWNTANFYWELITQLPVATNLTRSQLVIPAGGNYSAKVAGNKVVASYNTNGVKLDFDNPLWPLLYISPSATIIGAALLSGNGANPQPTDAFCFYADLITGPYTAPTANGVDFTAVLDNNGAFVISPVYA